MNPQNKEKAVLLRHELHKHAELSLKEDHTRSIIKSFFHDNTPFRAVETNGCLFVFIPGRTSGPVTAFRADMDALPIEESEELPYHSLNKGVSHKCGHDGHCAVLCGLALELAEQTPKKPVLLIFQPAEEIGAGGMKCLELLKPDLQIILKPEEINSIKTLKTALAGKSKPEEINCVDVPKVDEEKESVISDYLDLSNIDISEIYAFHNRSGLKEGTLFYRRGMTQPASEGIEISFYGCVAHAANSEEGKNPALAIAAIVSEAAVLSERTTNEKMLSSVLPSEASAKTGKSKETCGIMDASLDIASESENTSRTMAFCTVTGIRMGSDDFGISPGEGSVYLTLRAGSEAELKRMEQKIVLTAQKQAEIFGLREGHHLSDVFPETRNHDDCLDKVLKTAAGMNIPYVELNEIWRPSEDFGYYLKYFPGAMIYIGNGENYPEVHSKEYDFNDRIIPVTVDLFKAIALIDETKAGFKAQ